MLAAAGDSAMSLMASKMAVLTPREATSSAVLHRKDRVTPSRLAVGISGTTKSLIAMALQSSIVLLQRVIFD